MKDLPKTMIKTEPTLSWQAVNVQAKPSDIWKALKEAMTVSEKEREYQQEKVISVILIRIRLEYCGPMITIMKEY